jgi:hypothetical protein
MAVACKAANPLPGGTPDADSAKPDGQGTEIDSEKTAAVVDGDLARADAPAAHPPAAPAAAEASPTIEHLLKTMGTMAETLQAVAAQNVELRARVEDIAQTPLPPRAIAPGSPVARSPRAKTAALQNRRWSMSPTHWRG